MSKTCECGRTLCDLCEEKRAAKVMRNVRTGKKLNVCDECYEEVWGKERIKMSQYTIRRDEYGHAMAIERDGYTVLHLQPGTERNEQEVEGVVALLNATADNAERVKPFQQRLVELTIEENKRIYKDGINAPEGAES